MTKSAAKRNHGRPATGSHNGVSKHPRVQKKLTGIVGFDQITDGGLPEGRCTTVVGGPGTGKSLFAMQHLVNRQRSAGEPGLFVTFEELSESVRSNLAGLDWSFDDIPRDKLVLIDAIIPGDTVQVGSFDLGGLLAGLSAHKAKTGARNVVFDGIDVLIGRLNDDELEQRELSRIDEWIRKEDVSAIITVKTYGASERDQRRSDLIHYMTDCVVHLNAELFGAKLTRTLRVVKYRGSGFAGNTVPMAIGKSGVEVIPSQTSRLGYPISSQRLSSGIPRLDAVLGGGFIRGTAILITGAPGTSKTSLAASLVATGCANGGKALFVSFDESEAQIIANMTSIAIDLGSHVASGHLAMMSLQSAGDSPEECYLKIWNAIRRHSPDILVIDPLSAFADTSYPFAAAISENLIDLAKLKGITFLSTSLLGQANGEIETSASHVSTIADTWLHLSYVVQNGERNRALTIVKSRGTEHSNQVRELSLSSNGLDLIEVYMGDGGVLLGSARIDKQQKDLRDEKLNEIAYRRRKSTFDREMAELMQHERTAREEMAAKRLEAELEESMEQARIEASQAAVDLRAVSRRKSDDALRVSQPRETRKRPER